MSHGMLEVGLLYMDLAIIHGCYYFDIHIDAEHVMTCAGKNGSSWQTYISEAKNTAGDSQAITKYDNK